MLSAVGYAVVSLCSIGQLRADCTTESSEKNAQHKAKMMFDDTDRDWEKLAKHEPYFAVITSDKFRNANLTRESKEEFFAGGLKHIHRVLQEVREHVDPSFSIKRALDFGCGVGRVVIPLANIAQEVTGVDVSDSMLKEARKNCEARSIKNVVLVKSDDNLSVLDGKYDFIHSHIVFQHIPVERGQRIFENLLAHLETDGVCVVHFTYAKDYPTRRWASFIKRFFPWSRNLINLIRGRNFFAPEMQMNAYDLNQVFSTIQKANVLNCHMTFTNHAGELGIIVGFRKPKTEALVMRHSGSPKPSSIGMYESSNSPTTRVASAWKSSSNAV